MELAQQCSAIFVIRLRAERFGGPAEARAKAGGPMRG
jgi:hypothetical protein